MAGADGTPVEKNCFGELCTQLVAHVATLCAQWDYLEQQ